MSRDAQKRAPPFCLRLDFWIHFLTKHTSAVTNQRRSGNFQEFVSAKRRNRHSRRVRYPEPAKAEMLIGIRKSWADFEIER